MQECFDDDPTKFYCLGYYFRYRKSMEDLFGCYLHCAFIGRDMIPVLLIQPGTPKRLFTRRNRKNLDRVMRRKLLGLACDDARVNTPYVYAISGIGKSLAYNKVDATSKEIEPKLAPEDPNDPSQDIIPASD